MKKIYLMICAFFAAFCTLPSFMDSRVKNRILSTSFDSLDDSNDYDENDYDEDSYDEYGNKKGGKMKHKSTQRTGVKWVPSNGYFTINIVNGIAANTTIELFNSLRSWASVSNSVLGALLPFCFTGRDAANANSTVNYATNGDLLVTSAAGTVLTISCPDIPYRTLIETLKFYQINVKSLKLGFTNTPQLTNTLNFTEQTFLGRNNNNTLNPKAFFGDMNFQSKQVTITTGFIINGEKGINFVVNNGETMDLTFMLSAIAKN